jgi:glycosyltransferase involved in cell wall biosynthesis
VFESGTSPDVFNAHTALPDGFAATKIARRFDTPLVTTVHGTDLQKSITLPLAERLMRDTFERSARTVVNSSKLERLANNYFESLDVTVIPNGVPIAEINRARTRPKPAEVSTDRDVLISVANLIPAKGHRFVIEALATLENDVQYLIVGDGTERERLQGLVQEHGLHDDVVFLGRIPHHEVFEYLWHSDVFVLPSYEEAFGIAYIEAMACELPTIACRGEGPEDFIQHGETGYLVPPRDAPALANQLSSLLHDPDERETVGARARDVITSRYTWSINVDRTEKLFQGVV